MGVVPAVGLSGSENREFPVRRASVLGVGVDLVDPGQAIELIVRKAREGGALSVTALAVHGVMTGWRSGAFRQVLARTDLVVADGQPVRWALNWLYSAGIEERVYGPDLMLDICRVAADEGLPVFLYGSSGRVLEMLAGELRQRNPGLVIAGWRPSAFGSIYESEQASIAAEIAQSGAAVCFVGIGCPRQEVFTERLAPIAGIPFVAVGAAFDFHAGSKKTAPRWMQSRGLEWLFRLMQEPSRLWRRYLLLNPLYLALLVAQKAGLPVGSRPAGEQLPGGPVPG